MSKTTAYPNIDRCNPRTCISGNMMKCNRIVANVFRKYLHPFGITDSQLSMLFVITKSQSLNQKKIAEILFLEKSTVNRNITRLINKQLIAFDEHRFLHTTPTGLQFLEEVIPHWDEAMAEISTRLGAEGTQAVRTITQQLAS